jgi:two-component system, NarL family, nitrate/nitrite response regulator NarL
LAHELGTILPNTGMTPTVIQGASKDAGRVSGVLVVDDHALVRHGLVLALRELHPTARVDEAGSLADALDLLRKMPLPSLVLYDLFLGEDDDEETALSDLRRMISILDGRPLIVVSGMADKSMVIACIRAGAKGYLLKSCSPEILEHAVSLVLTGEVYVPMPRAVIGPPANPEAAAGNRLLDRLTGRQRDVFQLLLAGQSNKEIARSLGVLEGTVKVHVRAIMQKLGVKNRTQVAVAAARAGCFSEDA